MHIDRESLRKKNPDAEGVSQSDGLQGEAAEETAAPGKKVSIRTSSTEEVSSEHTKKERRIPRKYIWLGIAIALILITVVLKIWLDNSYHPADQYKELDKSGLNIAISDNMIVVRNPDKGNTQKKTGIIFYQDFRVDGECYLPLMVTLAQKGYDCFLPFAFGNQSYLNVEGAESIIRKYSSISQWVLVAHNEACSTAAAYVKGHPNRVHGLVYLGGSSYVDISNLPIPLLCIIGTNDTIVNKEKFNKNKANNPADTEYQIIEGANNSGFADTVLKTHDSKADISFPEQIEDTADRIDTFIQTHLS